MGQSTNDMFPTAIHVALALSIHGRGASARRGGNAWLSESGKDDSLIAALDLLRAVLADKAKQWDSIIKIGRTHLADATPIRLGQVFSGFARQVELSIDRARAAVKALRELPAGGTAVGTGINTHPQFGAKVAEVLSKVTGIEFVEAANHFEANANRDALVECSGQLRAIAVTLFNLSNNIRWLASGPRCGFYEIKLPDRQPGSSIMPGKVNPVMCESMMQVCARVIGNDQTVAFSGATGGNFELNIMMPIMGTAALESSFLLAQATRAFVQFCALDMEANPEACEASVEKSLAMVTSLNPHIGYEKAAALAKEAFKTGKTIRQLCQEQKILPESVLNEALDPWRMTEPH
jgi:fumarate hydratase class II